MAREGKTEKKPLERGLEIIKKSDLLGVVLNGCTDTDHDSYYQRYSPQSKVNCPAISGRPSERSQPFPSSRKKLEPFHRV